MQYPMPPNQDSVKRMEDALAGVTEAFAAIRPESGNAEGNRNISGFVEGIRRRFFVELSDLGDQRQLTDFDTQVKRLNVNMHSSEIRTSVAILREAVVASITANRLSVVQPQQVSMLNDIVEKAKCVAHEYRSFQEMGSETPGRNVGSRVCAVLSCAQDFLPPNSGRREWIESFKAQILRLQGGGDIREFGKDLI